MAFRGTGQTAGTLAIALLLVVVAVLATRSYQAARIVLGPARAGDTGVSHQEGNKVVEALAWSDSLIAAADPGARNPFTSPPARRRSSNPAPATPEETPADPTLGALLFDTLQPTIQLKLRGKTSEWLNQGDTFSGWTVKDIRPQTVVLEKDGRLLFLP